MVDEREEFKGRYFRYTFRKLLLILVCITLAVLFFFLSLTVGTLDLTMERVYQLFFDHLGGAVYDQVADYDNWYDDYIVWEYRVPRALMALLGGLSLGVAGAAMQSVMKNPLADPYTTGVSSGALFGIAVSIILGVNVKIGSSNMSTFVLSMICSMVPIAVIIVMAPFFRKSPSSLILSGIAVSYLFNSLTTLLMVTAEADSLAGVYSWQVGSLVNVKWEALPVVAVTTSVGLGILLVLSNKLNLMALDEKSAKAMGLNPNRLRVISLVVLAFMAATVVSVVGVIGFIGLVIPHIARMVLGSDNKFLIPASAALGAVFLLGCDIIARALPITAAVPVGVVTSFVGAPVFLYLIIRQKKGVW